MKYGPCSLGGVCLIAGIFQAKAEEINYPTRPVRIVTGFAEAEIPILLRVLWLES